MRSIFLALPLLTLIACSGNQNNETTETPELEVDMSTLNVYGDTITVEGALLPQGLLAQMEGKDSLEVKVEATINETCQVKGCWMTLDMGNDQQMRVSFKDYGFFVPKEGAQGKTAIIEGVAFMDTVSVDVLRHLAEDAGKSEVEIAAINTPEYSLNFEAHGVIIKD
jgi:hypothetical protein